MAPKLPAVPEYATSNDDLRERISRLAEATGPTFFRIRAQLPCQGRTEIPVAASETMSVIVKTYAGLGENELHRHPYEDHVFVVLQGTATFYGPHNEKRTVGRNEGVLIPGSAYYRFQAGDEEPLVMLRVGAATQRDVDILLRLDTDEKEVDGWSEANKQVEVILAEGKYFG